MANKTLLERIRRLETANGEQKIIVFTECLDDKNYFEYYDRDTRVKTRCTREQIKAIEAEYPNDVYIVVGYVEKKWGKNELA